MTDIAIYIPSLRGGGAERTIVTLANGLAARGLQVDLVLASSVGPYMSEVCRGVRVIDLEAGRTALSLWPLVRYLRKARPRSMLSAMNYANVISVLAHGLAKIDTRLVLSEHTDVSSARSQPQTFRQRCVYLLMRWAYSKADAVIAVSSGAADSLAQTIGLSREKIKVIYNPVVRKDLDNLAAEPLDHPWFQESECPVVLAVGRLSPEKDYPTLIYAFANVRAVRDCRLVILGEGESRASLEALVRRLGVEESVCLPGFMPNPFPWMRHASLFVLSSAWEGLSNVLIEAMACGVPVVSTDCPSGPREILQDGKWGGLVPVGEPELLAKKIERALDGDAVANASVRARHFGVEKALNGYMNLLLPDMAS